MTTLKSFLRGFLFLVTFSPHWPTAFNKSTHVRMEGGDRGSELLYAQNEELPHC